MKLACATRVFTAPCRFFSSSNRRNNDHNVNHHHQTKHPSRAATQAENESSHDSQQQMALFDSMLLEVGSSKTIMDNRDHHNNNNIQTTTMDETDDSSKQSSSASIKESDDSDLQLERSYCSSKSFANTTTCDSVKAIYGISPSITSSPRTSTVPNISETQAVVQSVIFARDVKQTKTMTDSPISFVYCDINNNNLDSYPSTLSMTSMEGEEDNNNMESTSKKAKTRIHKTVSWSTVVGINKPSKLTNDTSNNSNNLSLQALYVQSVDTVVQNLVKYAQLHFDNTHSISNTSNHHHHHGHVYLIHNLQKLANLLEDVTETTGGCVPLQRLCKRVFALHGEHVLFQALQCHDFSKHYQMRIHYQVCRALVHLTNVYGDMDEVAMRDVNKMTVLVQTIQVYLGKTASLNDTERTMPLEIVALALVSVANLLDQRNKHNADMFAQAGGIVTVIHILKEYHHHTDPASIVLQRNVCRILSNLCQWPEHLQIIQELQGRFIVALVYYSNQGDPLLKEWARDILVRMTPDMTDQVGLFAV
jgi:hypothetical protein